MQAVPVLEALKTLKDVHGKGVRFVDAHRKIKHISYSDLVAESSVFAASLLKRGLRSGEPVVLVMTESEAAIKAILGCMLAGCPPAPIYPPQNLTAVPNFLDFMRHVAERSRASFVISSSQPFLFMGNILHEIDSIRGVEKYESLINGMAPLDSTFAHDNPVAFLQFTSGSTSRPKGVIVTHEGLAANLAMIRESARMSRDSCVVTWLPVYHDMGLIGTVLNAITLPCDLVVLPPVVFLKRPRLWLELITEFKGTHTAAPNFAYGLCFRRVADLRDLDLSSMTTFICGAEPVLPKTMQSFVHHFAPAGLHPGAMVPAYGLAEATLAVTFSPFMRGLATDEADLEMLSQEAARPASENRPSITLTSCGLPMNGVTVRVSSENGEVLNDREVGEIQVKGPTVSPGYIGDEEETRASHTVDGWLRTGDLGYFANGELFVCGRIKDLIIVRGKNFHAHDLESVASEVRGVRTGNVVAFACASEEGESVIIVAETRLEGEADRIGHEIRAGIAKSFGITPADVLVVPAGTLPKTSSGKLKRSETRASYLNGALREKFGVLSALKASLQWGVGLLKRLVQFN